jgi:hypothetical protein
MLAHDLAIYLQARQPAGVPFEDAMQICMRLYSTVDGLPDSLHDLTSRDQLADAFALLGASGWIRGSGVDVDVSSLALWATVISSATAPATWVFDANRAEMIMEPFIGVS